MKTTILILFLSITIHGISEEIKKIKYGKVTLEELTMTTYPKDTSADAVILYSYGEFSPNQLKFTQHIRIKVLRQTGKSQANMVFYGRLKNNIKGCTYNLENGKIRKSQLKKESIFEVRKYGAHYNTSIALPDVRVGSVLEIFVTQDGVPNSFDFQQDIPVIYTALSFPPSVYADIECKESKSEGFTYKDGTTWIAKELPAFKIEPYMKSENDYKVRIVFGLSSIKDEKKFKPFGEARNDRTTWYIENPTFSSMFVKMY